MSELLSSAAAALGIPEALVERSAEARAAETGQSVDEILAAWAGGEAVEAPAAEAEAPAAEEAEPGEEPAEPEPTPEIETPQAPVIETPAAKGAGPVTRAPVPDEVTPGEAAHLPEVVTVPTAGIKERTNFVIPKWLTAVLLIVPAFALFALGGSATGQCGEATELRVDVVTGEIVNCDGSEFTGQAVDGGGEDFVALGADIYAGNAVAGVNCATCHGASGQGSGSFPALTGVMTTFGACGDHVEWVGLGSSGFVAAGRNTYGDTNKTIQNGMPAFSGSLSEEQLAAVAAFERVRLGGGDPDAVLADCGLVAPEDGEGGGEDGDGDTATTEGGEGTEASAARSG